MELHVDVAGDGQAWVRIRLLPSLTERRLLRLDMLCKPLAPGRLALNTCKQMLGRSFRVTSRLCKCISTFFLSAEHSAVLPSAAGLSARQVQAGTGKLLVERVKLWLSGS